MLGPFKKKKNKTWQHSGGYESSIAVHVSWITWHKCAGKEV